MRNKKPWLKRAIFLMVWLPLLAPPSHGGDDCDVSISFYSPVSDTIRTSDRWLAWDKAEHLGVSAFLSGVSYSILREFYNNDQEWSISFSASFTLTAGLGKELYDARSERGAFSYKDLVADLLGIGLGLFLATR